MFVFSVENEAFVRSAFLVWSLKCYQMHVFLMSAKNIATFIDEIVFYDSKLERKSGQQNMNACLSSKADYM